MHFWIATPLNTIKLLLAWLVTLWNDISGLTYYQTLTNSFIADSALLYKVTKKNGIVVPAVQ